MSPAGQSWRREAPPVFVTDSEERSSLGVLRGLARAGYRVVAIGSERFAPARWSRLRTAGHRLPAPGDDPERFVAGLAGLAGAEGCLTILPGSDAALVALSERREALAPAVRLGLPPHEDVLRVLDKRALFAQAPAAGLLAPETVPCDGADAAVAAAAAMGYPVVVKPWRSLVDSGGRLAHRPSRLAPDEDSVRGLIAGFGGRGLVQRVVRGNPVSCSGTLAGGELLGFAMSRYLRTWPPEGGNVAAAESVVPPDGVAGAVGRLVGGLGWQGIFELELMEDAGGGLTAIDLNPRAFGSISLPLAAGASLAALWCDWLGGHPPAPVVAAPGHRYRWEDGDARHLLRQARRGRLGAAAAVLRPRPGTVHAYFSARDPLPFLARALYLARRVFR